MGSGAIVELASPADRSHPSYALENRQTEKSVDNSMNNYGLTISIRPSGMVYFLTRSLYRPENLQTYDFNRNCWQSCFTNLFVGSLLALEPVQTESMPLRIELTKTKIQTDDESILMHK